MSTRSQAGACLATLLILLACPCTTAVLAQPTGSWEALETEGSPSSRAENAFVELDGLMYLIGGGPAEIDIYDPETNAWTKGAAVPERVHHFQAVAHDRRIYVVGAWIGGYPRQDGITHVLVYDPATDAWSRGHEIPEHRRRGGAGAVVYDDHIYVVGGNVGGHGPHAQAVTWLDRLNPETGVWEELPDAPHRRDHFQAVIVDGKVYAAAGRTSDIEGYIDSTVAAVDVYDIETESWSVIPNAPIPSERAGTPTAAVGKYVIVTGGEGFGKAWSETEALDTETGTWHLIGHLNQQRHGTQMFYHDGMLWIAGGAGNQAGGPSLVHLEVFHFDE